MRVLPILLLAAAPLAAQPAPQAMMMQAPPASVQPLPGYVADRPLLSLLRLLPPPPDAGSGEAKADQYLHRESRRGIGGVEWRKAQGQLGIGSADYQKAVACAVGATINYKTTPATMTLLIRAGADLSRAVTAAKDYYKRPRPFTIDRGKACDPESAVDGGKRLGFAYPSGHAGIGWLWGLILADVRAERSAEVLKFGKATGDLRIACRVHWASDVTGGRLLATALYQQIADTADYKADLLKARSELMLAPVPEGCPAG
jgi:acid phosphatase (class A)